VRTNLSIHVYPGYLQAVVAFFSFWILVILVVAFVVAACYAILYPACWSKCLCLFTYACV